MRHGKIPPPERPALPCLRLIALLLVAVPLIRWCGAEADEHPMTVAGKAHCAKVASAAALVAAVAATEVASVANSARARADIVAADPMLHPHETISTDHLKICRSCYSAHFGGRALLAGQLQGIRMICGAPTAGSQPMI